MTLPEELYTLGCPLGGAAGLGLTATGQRGDEDPPAHRLAAARGWRVLSSPERRPVCLRTGAGTPWDRLGNQLPPFQVAQLERVASRKERRARQGSGAERRR